MKKILLGFLLIMTSMSSLMASDIIVQKYHNNAGQSINVNNDVRYNALGYLNQLLSSMTNQLIANKDFFNIKNPTIAITTFVNLNNFKSTAEISNLISEDLIHEMQVRGFKVIDFKAMKNINITKDGDFVFSRNIEKLRKKINVDYILSGTYCDYKSGLMLNARIVDLKTQIILSTAQIMIPRHLTKYLKPYKQKIADFYPNIIELSK